MLTSSAVLLPVLALWSVHQSEAHIFKKSKGVAPPPLFGRVLYGHPIPGVYSVPTPLSSYGPHYPVRAIAVPNKHSKAPTYLPRPPPAYPLSPPPTVYHPPQPYPAQPVYPAYHPPPLPSYPEYHAPSYPAPVYSPYPPAAPSYPEYTTQAPATTYAPPVQPESYNENSIFPIPTAYDNQPWKPLPAEPLPGSEQPAQLVEADGYPWTPELESDPQSEAVKEKIPDVIFYPEKPIALIHSSANEVEFNPNPALLNSASEVSDATYSPIAE